jgi:arylsulfatase A-like enzyme
VIIVVFDALSALNLSMHGYGRETMPNLERLAKRAVVYHQNYAGSNFTTSGTASLLTGTLPWTHRAIEPNGTVADGLLAHNIFAAFPDYYRIAFTHNSWAMTQITQFEDWIDEVVPRRKLYLDNFDAPVHELFHRDDDIADVAWIRGIKIDEGYSYSLYLSRLYQRVREAAVEGAKRRFPRGLPMTTGKDAFLLEHAVSWVGSRLKAIPKPFLGYFHFLPPHAPYATSMEFYDRFGGDGLVVPEKPLSGFGDTKPADEVVRARRQYDEYVLYADQAFADLYALLESSGLLEDTWLVLTSDHGELFERGFMGHGGLPVYEPVIRTPLVIFEPGREQGLEIHTPSSAIDLLPTLASITGHAVPDWSEGVVLPPYSAGRVEEERPILAMQARKSRKSDPITNASLSMRRGRHKLIHYMGSVDGAPDGRSSVYDLVEDPEELRDLAAEIPDLKDELLAKLMAGLARSNAALGL